MDFGQYPVHIFASLVVVLGAACVALICDFLKRNNEYLRELTIELKVRHEKELRDSRVMIARKRASTALANEREKRATAHTATEADSPLSDSTRNATAADVWSEGDPQIAEPPMEQLLALTPDLQAVHLDEPVLETYAATGELPAIPVADDVPAILASSDAPAMVDTSNVEPSAEPAEHARPIHPARDIEPVRTIQIETAPLVEIARAGQNEPGSHVNPAPAAGSENQVTLVVPVNSSKRDWDSPFAHKTADSSARFTDRDAARPVVEICEDLLEAVVAATASDRTRSASDAFPAGFHDGFVLSRLVQKRQPVSGLVVSIGVNTPPNSHGSLPGAVRNLIESLIGPEDFACQSSREEFLLIYPQERGASAQRRLSGIAQRLWDFQLRSLGTFAILFTWGGVEVHSESMEEAVASATERMHETRRGRKLLTMEPRAETVLRQAV
jgi:hypothetical protein